MISDLHERFYGLTLKKTIAQFTAAIGTRLEELKALDVKRVETIGAALKKASVDMPLERLMELVENQIELRLGGARLSPELVALLREADTLRMERGYAKGLARIHKHLVSEPDQNREVLVPAFDLTVFEPYDPAEAMRNTPQRFYGDDIVGAPLGVATAMAHMPHAQQSVATVADLGKIGG